MTQGNPDATRAQATASCSEMSSKEDAAYPAAFSAMYEAASMGTYWYRRAQAAGGMQRHIRCVLRIVALMLLWTVFAFGFWRIASLDISGEGVTELAAAQSALKALGLPETAASPALSFNTQAWMGEGEVLTIFEVSEPLMAFVAQAEGWRVEAVSAADYAAFAALLFDGAPPVSPPSGTLFDAWYYRSDAPQEELLPAAMPEVFLQAGVAFSSLLQAAFFDVDTGLLFYYRRSL